MIHIEHFTFNAFQERTLLVWDNDGFCTFVDPGFSTTAERDELTGFVARKGLKPVCIMLTHAHFDHIYGVADLAHTYNVPIYMHKKENHTLEVTNPYLCKAFGLPEPAAFKWNDLGIESDNPCIKVGSLTFEVIETPGHTPGGVCFLVHGRFGRVYAVLRCTQGHHAADGQRSLSPHRGGFRQDFCAVAV